MKQNNDDDDEILRNTSPIQETVQKDESQSLKP